MSRRMTICPVITALVRQAPSLAILYRIGWGPVIQNAITTLQSQQKR